MVGNVSLFSADTFIVILHISHVTLSTNSCLEPVATRTLMSNLFVVLIYSVEYDTFSHVPSPHGTMSFKSLWAHKILKPFTGSCFGRPGRD